MKKMFIQRYEIVPKTPLIKDGTVGHGRRTTQLPDVYLHGTTLKDTITSAEQNSAS
jgi:hypothetical protein